MSDDELDEARDFLMSKKHLCRLLVLQTDLDADIAAGNIWIAYAAGSYVAAKDADLDVVYSEPKEGRLGWNCGFVLMADTENFRHAHEFVVDAWSSVESAEWIINNYAYGHANTSVNLANVPEDYVAVFHLDDPEAARSRTRTTRGRSRRSAGRVRATLGRGEGGLAGPGRRMAVEAEDRGAGVPAPACASRTGLVTTGLLAVPLLWLGVFFLVPVVLIFLYSVNVFAFFPGTQGSRSTPGRTSSTGRPSSTSSGRASGCR